LAPGTYTINANDIEVGDLTYSAGNPSRSASITAGEETVLSFTYELQEGEDPSVFNRQQTERLEGTWEFTYTIIDTFTDTYTLADVEEDSDRPGVFNIFGINEFGGPVIAGYDPDNENFNLFDPGSIINQLFVFDFQPNSNSQVRGCYYLISGDDISDCYSMTGSRISPSSLSEATHVKGAQQATVDMNSLEAARAVATSLRFTTTTDMEDHNRLRTLLR
jgi:hypothetical protein